MNIKLIKSWVSNNKTTCLIWFSVFSLSFIFTLLQQPNKTENNSHIKSLDTYIPEGFVLMPIELINGSSLDGLLEQKGVVDLYTGHPGQKRVDKVASAVKIIRSPMNPLYFAILVPEDKASLMIQRFQSFYAVIQNSEQQKQAVIQPLNKKKQRSITIELDKSSDF